MRAFDSMLEKYRSSKNKVTKKGVRRLLLYMFRWQLSTPILAVVMGWLADLNYWLAAIISNLIGSLIFYWVDKFIFNKK